MFRNSVRTESDSGSGVRNRIGDGGSLSRTKNTVNKVTDVRQLLEEKRQGSSLHRQQPPVATTGKTGQSYSNLYSNVTHTHTF